MDMRQVRHLIAVAEHGSMLRAAGTVHISQPALSKSIQNLEAELGVPLLERGPRGVTPRYSSLSRFVPDSWRHADQRDA